MDRMELPSLNFLSSSGRPWSGSVGSPQGAQQGSGAAAPRASSRFVTAGGIVLPDIGFAPLTVPRTASGPEPAPQSLETSYFAQCKIQLKSLDPRIGERRDARGSVVITPDPSTIKFTVDRYPLKFLIADPNLQIRKRSDHTVSLRDSSKAVVTLSFRLSVAYLSFLATIFLHRRAENETFADAIKGEGHELGDKDEYDVLLTSWKFRSPTQLGDLIEDKAPFNKETLPAQLKPALIGFQLGGLRLLWLRKKVVAAQLRDLREFRPRVRTPVIYGRFLELQQLCDQLLEISDTVVRRGRVQRTVAAMKSRLDELTAAVDKNTILIEQMHEEKEQFIRKMSEVERAKRRIDVDESELQTQLLRQQVSLRIALNEIVQKTDDLGLELLRFSGDAALVGKSIAAAFTVVCCGMAEGDEDLEDRLENVRRMLAESVFL
jgi:hypothetical protein